MPAISEQLTRHGYAVATDLLSPARCDAQLAEIPTVSGSGSRLMLEHSPFRELAQELQYSPQLRELLAELKVVQCIYFRKAIDHNWSIRLHRDDLLPRLDNHQWPPAGMKQGQEYAKPPRQFLDNCIAVRLHLDGAPEGDLHVVPGSHLGEKHYSTRDATSVPVARGGALIMRPRTAHASTKLVRSEQRRVLHFVFAPADAQPKIAK